MLLVRSSEFPGPKVVLVLGEARTAPENFLQEIGLRESAGRPEESDRLIESQDRIGILRDDVDIVRDQKDRDVRFSLQPVKALIEHVFAADVDRGGRLVEEEDIRPIEDGPCDEDALHLSPRENVEPLREDRASETDPASDSSKPAPPLKPRKSRTVIGTSVTTKFCGTYPIRTGPDQLTVPVCGTSPRRTRKRVVFPAPFGPTIASVVPLRTWKLTSSKIGTWSNRTPRFATRRTSASAPVSRLGPLDGGGATTIRRGSSDAVI